MTTDRYINLFNDGDIESLKDYWDLRSVVNTYYREGLEEGMELGKEQGIAQGAKEKAIETARNALKEGLSLELIQKLTGLSEAEIRDIL